MKPTTGRKDCDYLTEKSKIIPIKSINKSVPTKLNSERTGEQVLDISQLQDLKSVGAVDSNLSSLTELKGISVDTSQPTANRMISFAKQIKNPYLFKVGEIAVKVEYGEGKNLSDALVDILNAG